MDSETRFALEQMIDREGCEAIASALAELCQEKADHIRSSYQDETLAKCWERNSKAFDVCSNRVTA